MEGEGAVVVNLAHIAVTIPAAAEMEGFDLTEKGVGRLIPFDGADMGQAEVDEDSKNIQLLSQ